MGFPVICRLINTLLFNWLIRKGSGVSKRVCLVPSSETQGQPVESGEKARECFQARAEEPLGTDSHRTISKRSSECWLLFGPKKMLWMIVPNRRTASPEFFSCVHTRRLLSRHTCA